jgi:CheY-like chemotaxis protein
MFTTTSPNQTQAIRLSRGDVAFVVDDDDAMGAFVEEVLTQLGLAVTRFTDGHEVLRALRCGDRPCDLLVSDLTMPRLSGRELCQAASSIRPELPCLLVSGEFERAAHGEAAATFGALALLPKRDLISSLPRMVAVQS